MEKETSIILCQIFTQKVSNNNRNTYLHRQNIIYNN